MVGAQTLLFIFNGAPAEGLGLCDPALAPHQSPFHTFEPPGIIERLAQETDCPGVHCLLSNLFLGERSNENHRRAVTPSNQALLQLDAAHAGHLHIRNEAGRVAQSRRSQKFLRRSKRICRKSQ
jgi:hypothetical protein